jgi:D-alanine-D-alanine ligase
MLQKIKSELPQIFFREQVPFRDITTLGCGGLLPLLAEVKNLDELAAVAGYLSRNRIPMLFIGGGSNLAGMDAPFAGVAVRLAREYFNGIEISAGLVRAETGVRLAELARTAAEAGFGGLAAFAGIPGTLGGALRMNAGAHGHCIGELVESLTGVRTDGRSWQAAKNDLVWNYRQSSIPADVIVTAAVLRLPDADPKVELANIAAETAARRAREPKGRTAGCMFRNAGSESAGKLIDECGLKGCRRGSFEVSGEHANYIVNTNGGSEADLLELMTLIRRTVAERCGIYLEPEVVFADPTARDRLRAAVPAPRIAVLKGGVTSEREVSLRSGAAVGAALRNAGYQVREIDLTTCEILPEMTAADVVYPVLHGGFGEDGRIQKLLEDEGIAFVGSGSESCRRVMDKITTKEHLDAIGLPHAKWAVLTPEKRAFPAGLKFPVVLKAPCEGSTIGIEKVDRIEDFAAALDRVFKHDPKRILVEEFIRGIEITVPVIGEKVFPIIEIRSPHGFYDYDAKYVYKDGKTEYFCPAPSLSPEMAAKIGEYTEKFFREFGCRDIMRVDFIIDGSGKPHILEGNSIPGCTATSLVPKSARVANLSFERMAAQLVQAALRRRNRTNGSTSSPGA